MLYYIGDPRYVERVCPAMHALLMGTHGKCGKYLWKAERNTRPCMNQGRIWHATDRDLVTPSDD